MDKTPSKAESNVVFSIDQLVLENVTLKLANAEPVLQNVDISLPMDQTIVVESSNPNHALYFLQFLAGYKTSDAGRILWNGQDIFSEAHVHDPRESLGAYFEGSWHAQSKTLKDYLQQFLTHEAFEAVSEQFELSAYLNNDFSKLSYAFQKLMYMTLAASKSPQLLILEDPASGLTEAQWLNYLDFVQYQQRQGGLRHVFMTNHHPLALNHIEHNKIFIEDGLIYFDETQVSKKVAHF